MKQQLAETVAASFETVMLPSFERACKEMLRQVHSAVAAGLEQAAAARAKVPAQPEVHVDVCVFLLCELLTSCAWLLQQVPEQDTRKCALWSPAA